VAEARAILADTPGTVAYEPCPDERWQEAYQRFCRLPA